MAEYQYMSLIEEPKPEIAPAGVAELRKKAEIYPRTALGDLFDRLREEDRRQTRGFWRKTAESVKRGYKSANLDQLAYASSLGLTSYEEVLSGYKKLESE